MLPAGYNVEKYLPTEEDFEKVLQAKKTGNYFQLPYYPLRNNEPYQYPTIRLYLTAILLKWEELGKEIEKNCARYQIDANGNTTDTPYFTPQDLAMLRTLAIQYKDYFIDAYNKYREEGQSLESPEKITQRARDAKKGQIEVKIKGNGGLLRLIPYSMKYGNNDPNKSQTGAKMYLFFGEKTGNGYKIVVRGSNLYGSGKDPIDDCPFFETEQEARDFIANIDHNHLDTKVTIEDWRYVITDRPFENGYARDTDGRVLTKPNGMIIKNYYTPRLTDAHKVDTICGPAWMLDSCKYYKESLDEEAKLDELAMPYTITGYGTVETRRDASYDLNSAKERAEKMLDDEFVKKVEIKNNDSGEVVWTRRNEELENDNPFDQLFEAVNAYGEVVNEAKESLKFTCCICGEESEGYGNNPEPIKHDGKCCDACNRKFVIPARLLAIMPEEDEE